MSPAKPSRPQWNHPQVKDDAACEIVDDVLDWFTEGATAADGVREQVAAVICAALREGADAYDAGRFLDDRFDWAVDGTLVRILDRAYQRMRPLATRRVHEWVMQTGTRFKPKTGDLIRARVPGGEIKGRVRAVIAREGRGVIEVPNNVTPINGPANRESTMVEVEAEDVIEIVKTASTTLKKPRPTSNGDDAA